MKIILIITLILMIGLAGCKDKGPATAKTEPANATSPVPMSSSAAVVRVRTGPVTIAPGEQIDATITLSITSGFHVNANPATFSYLIPTEVTAEGSPQLSVARTIYPAAQTRKFQFAEKPLAVYEGDTQIKLPLSAKAGAVSTSIPIKVRVQACDNEQCFPPATLNTTLAINVK